MSEWGGTDEMGENSTNATNYKFGTMCMSTAITHIKSQSPQWVILNIHTVVSHW